MKCSLVLIDCWTFFHLQRKHTYWAVLLSVAAACAVLLSAHRSLVSWVLLTEGYWPKFYFNYFMCFRISLNFI